MRLIVCWLVGALTIEAGVIQGVVLEQASGLPLARTQIRLQPVPKAGGGEPKPFQTRTEKAGHFVFPRVPPGLYLVIATRENYFPAAYGQRRPSGTGTPIEVKEDSEFFSELRMRRRGAITGRILDENGVGMEGVPVLAYRARLPLRIAGHAESDDRGVYRIHGLDPGKYWVRTAAITLNDGLNLLPTFGPETREAHEARIHAVIVDGETTDADIRPEPGALFRMRGKLQCTPGQPVTVTLSSETGKQSKLLPTCAAPGAFDYEFEGLAPGVYELFAMTQDKIEAGFADLFLDHDSDAGNLSLGPLPRVSFDVRPDSQKTSITLVGRRQDLAEAEQEHEIPLTRTTLAPGHWELNANVGENQYVESIANQFSPPRRRNIPERLSYWFPIFLETRGNGYIRVTISDRAGTIAGTVTSNSQNVPGVPVFLYPVAEAARKSVGVKQLLSNTEGGFQFTGLPPGDYRLLATFDINEVDEQILEEAKAPTIRVDASQTSAPRLELWLAP